MTLQSRRQKHPGVEATVKCGGLRFGDVAWRPVTREGWKPTDRRRERGDL